MPLQDNDRYLTWNQYSVTRREHDLVGNIGLASVGGSAVGCWAITRFTMKC